MQQLEIEHKKLKSTNSNQKFVSNEEKIVEQENKREGHGLNIALTRNVFYLLGSKDVYYVQSEHSDNIYYFVKYNHDVFEYCSCPDNSMRGIKCKHIWSIEKSILKSTLKQIEHLPENAQRYPQKITANSYQEDQYDF